MDMGDINQTYKRFFNQANMSDYDYDEEYQYEEPEEEEVDPAADIEANIEVDYFDAEELFRKGKNEAALHAIQDIYKTADEKNLRNWKIKAITQMLQIYVQLRDEKKIKETLHTIGEINAVEKISENTIKMVILTLQELSQKAYGDMLNEMLPLVESLDANGQLKSYVLMMTK